MTPEVPPVAFPARTGSLPDTTRRAGPAQGILLVAMSCLAVLGAVLLAPAQPRMLATFSGDPSAGTLVPMTITAPALMIALLSPVAGRLVDRIGRLRLLTGALVMYAVFGTAPLWLPTLTLIVISRIGVGIAEAAIMTCCITLLADYFQGKQRVRYLGLQVTFSAVAAVVFVALGGALAEVIDWRNLFWLYSVSLVFLLLVPVVLWQPPADSVVTSAARMAAMEWRPLLWPLVAAFIGGVVFFTPIVQLSYALDGVGVESAGTIGAISALASLATAITAIVFSRVAKFGARRLLPIAFAASGLGLMLMGYGNSVLAVTFGGVLASAGGGLLLPTLLTWVLCNVQFDQRGRATGAYNFSVFGGEFVCPLIVIAAAGAMGGLTPALIAVGIVALVVAVFINRTLRSGADDLTGTPA